MKLAKNRTQLAFAAVALLSVIAVLSQLSRLLPRRFFLIELPKIRTFLPYGKANKLIHRVPPPHLTNVDRNTTKLILLWTGFFGDENWRAFFGKENETLFFSENSEKKCTVMTSNRLRVDEADAVIFHGPDVNYDNVPFDQRISNQFWTYFALESPSNLHLDIEPVYQQLNKIPFNWTMSFSRKSDIWFPYGKVTRLPALDPLQQEAITKRISLFKRRFQARQRDAVWIVSNCVTMSNREILYRRLVAFGLDVEVIGKCMEQPLNGSVADFDFSQYRYYLAFENSICDDYVTEKAFQALKMSQRDGVIPVVFGGANYSQLLPPNSYVDALSFNSVLDLAQYLKSLSSSQSLLAPYYDWHLTHALVDYDKPFGKHHVATYGWPALCDKLWQINASVPMTATADVRDHLGSCRTLQDKFFNLDQIGLLAEQTIHRITRTFLLNKLIQN